MHLNALDMLVKSFIKKWLAIPSRGVTNVGLFHPYMLNINQPSKLYMDTRLPVSVNDPVTYGTACTTDL